MRDIGKFLVTLFVWLMCSAVGFVTVVESGGISSGGVMVIGLTLMIAYLTTKTLWQEKSEPTRNRRHYENEKQKRGTSKTDLLLSLMDEDEQLAFKEALKQRMLESSARLNDDGEIDAVSLETLLDDTSNGSSAMYRRK